MSIFDQVFFKVAPRDFAAFVYDTNDLSITRGGSLTLLAMPGLLLAHLQSAFPELQFELIQGAASELFFAVEKKAEGGGAAGLTIEPVKENLKNPLKGQVNKAANNLKDKVLSDEVLRAAARAINEKLKEPQDVDRIAGMILAKLGNVAGRVAGNPIGDDEAGRIEAEIRKFLRQVQGDGEDAWPFDLLRFGVARFRPETADPDSARPGRIIAALETALGLEKMRALSCPVPSSPNGAGGAIDMLVCSYNRHLAAGETVKGRPASDSAHRRWQVGRAEKRKRGVYERVLAHGAALAAEFGGKGLAGAAVELVEDAKSVIAKGQEALAALNEFANDFEQIVHLPPDGVSLSAGSGLCLLRMDGNRFGSLRARQPDLPRYRRLADYLDILKSRLMARIIIWLAGRADMAVTVRSKHDEGDRTRFETLLWGGDEFAFVCPAWAGWALARVIAGETGGWVDLDGQPLHVATGIGFAHHKTPVAQFLDAVGKLEELAKADRDKSLVVALPWEGVDRVHLAPESYMARLYGAKDAAAALSFPAADLGNWVAWRRRLADAVGRSALHRWAGFGGDESRAWETILEEMKRIGTDGGREVLAEIGEEKFAGTKARPVLVLRQLLFLHDYLEPDLEPPASSRDAA